MLVPKPGLLAIALVALAGALVGCGGDDDGADAGQSMDAGPVSDGGPDSGAPDGGPGPLCPGPGATPPSGTGTFLDPYEIAFGVSYGGCANAQQSPGPVYAIEVETSGTYSIAQTNGITDLELWIYDDGFSAVDVLDEEWGGYPEVGSGPLSEGVFYIEVYNNGGVFGVGDQDSPFTLEVDGPL